MSNWSVYVVRTRGDAIYSGIATDVARRIEAHAAGRGAKFLRGRGPLELVFQRRLGDRSLALRIEARLKRLTKEQKEALVRARPSRMRLLRLLQVEA
jgi:putative endonuclease